MNAQTPIKPDNLAIWNALGKTDPKHTKPFSRAGGFKGTALKPIWIVRQLTDQFGPVGQGWGMDRPQFQVVEAGGETLVYCTVACWAGTPDNCFYGVGGDKVSTKRQSGIFNDDEAFKKAFTDAVGNAFKFLGVGADIHMGQFDDSKYVQQVAAEFAEGHSQQGAVSPPQPRRKLEGPYTSITALQTAIKAFVHELEGCGDYDELRAFLDTPDSVALIEQMKRDKPDWWNGWDDQPDNFIPLHRKIELREAELAQQIADIARA